MRIDLGHVGELKARECRSGWWNVDTVLNGHHGLGERRGEHAAAGDPRGVECPIDAMQMREQLAQHRIVVSPTEGITPSVGSCRNRTGRACRGPLVACNWHAQSAP